MTALAASPPLGRRLGDRLLRREEPPREGLPPTLGYHPGWTLYRWVTDPVGLLAEVEGQDAFCMRLPGVGTLACLADPAAIRDVFTGPNDAMSAGQANASLATVLGQHSMLLLDGEKHLRQRRLLGPSFHGERMHAYGETMRDVAAASVRRWPRDTTFPVAERMQGITLDVILHTVFGVAEGPRAARLRTLITELTETARSPIWLLPAFQKDLGRLTPFARIVEILQAIDAELYALVYEQRREDLTGREDILALMIGARDERGRPMTPVELRDELMTMLVAGHETTATSLAWCFDRLVRHPEAYARVREELDAVVGDGPLDPATSGRLEILDGFLRETLRLQPIIPFVGRRLLAPMTIGRWSLPKGTVAAPCIYLTHRSPAHWPDPLRFDPMRFVGTRVSPYAFLPFGGGIRRCLGMAFALYEMRVVLATVLREVEVLGVPGHETRLVRRGITFAPSEGMPILVRDRRPRA